MCKISQAQTPLPQARTPDLLDFPLIALIRSRYVVGQRLRPREVMIATWSRYNVSLTSDLPSEPCHRTGDCNTKNSLLSAV